MKLYITLLLMFVLVPLVNAQEIPVFPQSTNSTLSVPCFFNGDICDTSVICKANILNPNGIELYNNYTMTKDVSFYNVNLTSSDTDTVGNYELSISCCSGATCFERVLNFQVTPSGALPLNTGQSTILVVILGIIIFISLIFLYMGFKSENLVLRVVGFAFGSIMILMLVLYTMFIINEAVSGTPNLVTGYETFLFVMRIIGTVLILGLVVVILLVMVKAWKIRRGLVN